MVFVPANGYKEFLRGVMTVAGQMGKKCFLWLLEYGWLPEYCYDW